MPQYQSVCHQAGQVHMVLLTRFAPYVPGDPTQGLAWAAARKRLADVVGTQVAAVNDLQLDRDVHQPGALPLVTAKAAALVRHLESYRVGLPSTRS